MRMVMADDRMLMCMTVRSIRRGSFGMLMLVMLVMGVPVSVLQRLMLVGMLVLLSEVQPDAENHKGRRQPK